MEAPSRAASVIPGLTPVVKGRCFVLFKGTVGEPPEGLSSVIGVRVDKVRIAIPLGRSMKITAYLKPHCGWSRGVRAIFSKYELSFEEKDIIHSPENYAEMVRLSGQPLSPCVIIEGEMLADVSGEEVENYLLGRSLVKPSTVAPEAPTNEPCSTEEELAKGASRTIRFF